MADDIAITSGTAAAKLAVVARGDWPGVAGVNPPAHHLLCYSHLRWRFVYQRPQHLMSRFARDHQVYFIEEPVLGGSAPDRLAIERVADKVATVVAHLEGAPDARAAEQRQRHLLNDFVETRGIERPVEWYYTPMSLACAAEVKPALTVYDCMDELSLFAGAPPELLARERALLARAGLVFTGGYSLYEHKRGSHRSVHAFPSAVDTAHFGAARLNPAEPDDQRSLPQPRLGFFGVIDERLDTALLDAVAAARPDWQLILIGPVVKIDPAVLPRRANIHYLGSKDYNDLPRYLAGWQVALMPFALNDATRFISPTKTPEYLAGGRPVVATAIRDVVRTYGDTPLVRVAGSPDAFIAACDGFIREGVAAADLALVDDLLAAMSWDSTWTNMKDLMQCAMSARASSSQASSALSPEPRMPASA